MIYVTKSSEKVSGFTLVELSIVIIIIGFLIAGISAGSSLIEQAKLNSVMNEFQNYRLIYNNFALTYNGVPGDFANASAFFPGCDTTNGNDACNGDGNGVIELCNGPIAGDDAVRVWRHLYLAGMVTTAGNVEYGGWSCLLPPGGGFLIAGGDGYPAWFPPSRISGRVISMIGGNNLSASGPASPYDNSSNQVCIYRDPLPGATAPESSRGGLTPSQILNIDIKRDDGRVSDGIATGFSTGLIRAADGTESGADSCVINGVTYDLNQTVSSCIACYKLN